MAHPLKCDQRSMKLLPHGNYIK